MCTCCNTTYYGQAQRHFFLRASEHLGITPLAGKFVKMPKISALFDMLLDIHKGSFNCSQVFLTWWKLAFFKKYVKIKKHL